MNETIDLAIRQLLDIELFEKTTSHSALIPNACTLLPVPSWKQACIMRGSDEASNAFSEARGRLTRRLSAEHRQAYRQWNVIARRARTVMELQLFPQIDARIDQIADLPSIEGGPQLVKDSVRWDFMCFIAEQTFSDFVAPSLYTFLIHVYANGFFPCGWNQVWPHGEVWVH